ncbi:MAG: DUF4395 domain-containing protein [Saprospiraceae bacterium]
MQNNIICPVSSERISENIVRKVAFQILALAIIYILLPNPFIPIFLAFDFYIRSFTTAELSLTARIAKWWNNKTKPTDPRLTDRAPKRFAAGIGFAFSVLIGISLLVGFEKTSLILAGILLFCAGMESFLGICVGCHFYTFWKYIGNRSFLTKISKN